MTPPSHAMLLSTLLTTTLIPPRSLTGGESVSPLIGIPVVVLFLAFVIWRVARRKK